MLLNNRIQYGILLVVAVIFFASVGYYIQPRAVLVSKIDSCNEVSEDEPAKINCWQEVIRGVFDEEGTEEAFEVFEVVYKNYDAFANSGCHRHAHRVGDMAYYFDYLTHKDLAKMNFPQGAIACGYGFYHGFFEHLIQDDPDVEFVTQVCEYARNNLEDVAPAISMTCYHGSGHGFLLARADELTRESQWTLKAFTEKPLSQCESLPRASKREIEECRQGVYNVIVDWMADGEYGLSYNTESPFEICDSETHERQPDCYYEMAQKLDFVSEFDPNNMVTIVERANRSDLHKIAMAVGVAGLIQHNPQGKQLDILSACQDITNNELGTYCLYGIVDGLVEHATPESEYRNAIDFCGSRQLTRDEQPLCYRELLLKLRRFWTEEKLRSRCEEGALSRMFCAQV